MFLQRFSRAKAVAEFAFGRVTDYADLLHLEFSLYRSALTVMVLAYVALMMFALGALAFISVAVVVTYWDSSYRTAIAWIVAAAWCVVGLAAWAVARVRAPDSTPFSQLGEQMRLDLDAIKGRYEEPDHK